MTNTLIGRLKSLKVKIDVVDGTLDVKAPKGVMNKSLMEEIRLHKDELIDFVNTHKAGKQQNGSIRPATPQACYPMSSAQRRLWILCQFEDTSIAYNIFDHKVLPGDIHQENLEKAIMATISRHEILRTVFRENEAGEVCQFILSPEETGFLLAYHDFSTSKDPRAAAERYINEDGGRAFDLAAGPLLRAALLRLSADKMLFVYNMHHIISDGWSMGVLTKDVMAFYDAFSRSATPALEPLPIQYKDYAVWQLARLEDTSSAQHREYWLQQLSGELPVTDLPSAKKRPVVKTTSGRSVSTFIPAALTTGLNKYAQEKDGSLFMGLLATLNALFCRYTGQRDLIIGSPMAGRDHIELEDQIGFYVNTVALRNQVAVDDSFDTLFAKVRQNTFQAYEHQHYPFDRLVEELKIKRDIGRSPVFDVMLILQNMADVVATSTVTDTETITDEGPDVSKYDLCFTFGETGAGISVKATFNTDIYETSLLEGFLRHFKQLLKGMLEQPHTQIGAVDYIPEAEKNELLYAFNATQTNYPKETSIIAQFNRQVQSTPDNTAVIYRDKRLSFAELDRLSDQYAAFLHERLQVRAGNKVLVSLDHDHQLLPVLLAVKKTGAVYVPVDPRTPAERTAYIEKDSSSVAKIDADMLLQMNAWRPAAGYVFPGQAVPENDTEFIIYTSGSTGLPKGTLIRSGSVNNRLHWMWEHYPFQADEVCCAKTSISFVDHIWEFYGPLLQGIPLVFYKKEELLNVPQFIRSLGDDQVTRIVLVPSLLRELISHPGLCHEYLRRLNLWISSGEALMENDVEKFYATLRREDVRLINIYGSTEVTADATYYDTWQDYNKYKDFKLFNFSLKEEVEKLVSSYDFSGSIIASRTFNELVKEEKFLDVRPAAGASVENYLQFLRAEMLPNIVNVGATSFVGHMTGAIPTLFRELTSLVVALNQNQVKIETSMIATLIEKQVIGIFHHLVYGETADFYRQYSQDPEYTLGVVNNGGTLSNVMALSYTLNKLLGPVGDFRGIKQEGLVRALRVYGYDKVALLGSGWCHYSFGKALKLLGLGAESFVPLDFEDKDDATIRTELDTIIRQLKAENTLILALVGIAGTTESGNIDPLPVLGEIAREHDIHYHVDAAFGGGFLMDDVLARKLTGIELAGSVSICAHKQLYMPIGLSVCLFKDPSFVQASENNTHYQARKGSYDLGKYTIEGSRNFMSLVLHAAFHIFGKEGFAQVVRHNYHTAQYFAGIVQQDAEFELMFQPDLNIVLYRYVPPALKGKKQFTDEEMEWLNDLNRKIQEEQFRRGNSFISYTRINKDNSQVRNLVFRAVFMNPYTTRKELLAMLEEQKIIADTVLEKQIIRQHVSKRENILIGKPIDNVHVYILDDAMRILPFGVTGEICVGGDCVAAGYISTGENAGAERFLDNPFVKGERLYRTGDLGRRWPDGNIEYVGRKDDMVKIHGNRVELSEVEYQLRTKEFISEAVVLYREMRSGERKLVAYFVSEQPESPVSLRRYLSEKLPAYMVPSMFVPLDKVPLTSSGKINRKALPDPEDLQLSAMQEYVAPRNTWEKIITTLCEQLLHVERAGIHDNFYQLGGDSIKLIQLLAQLRKDGYQVKPEQILQAPDLATIAALLESATQSRETPPRSDLREGVPAWYGARQTSWNTGDKIPVSFNQARMMKDKTSQGIIGPYVFSGADEAAAVAAFRRFLITYPELCIRFTEDAGVIYQQYVTPEDMPLAFFRKTVDLTDKTTVTREQQAVFEQPYDVLNGELIRLFVYDDGKAGTTPLLFVAISHALTDLHTNHVLDMALAAFLQSGRQPERKPGLSNFHFAAWQQHYLTSGPGQASRRFWDTYLKGALPAVPPATPPAAGSVRCIDQRLTITGAAFEQLSALAKKQHVSLSVALMAAHQRWIKQFSSTDAPLQLVIVNGRDNVVDTIDTTGILGAINNFLPVKMAAADERFYEQVNIHYLQAREHQAIPYEVIREDYFKATGQDIDHYAGSCLNFQQLEGRWPETNDTIPDADIHTYSLERDIRLDLTCKLKSNGMQVLLSCPESLFRQHETAMDLQQLLHSMIKTMYIS